MGYRITLGEEAALVLVGLSASVRRHVSAELRRLAENPVKLSSPAHFPHPLDGQLFHARPFIEGGKEHFLTFMFKYHEETILVVEWIVHQTKPV